MERFSMEELAQNAHIHFIGIGGISMSGLASIALKEGYKVTGSDRTPSDMTKELEKQGAVIFYQHDAKNIDGADLVVHTAAVKMDNPEMAAAKEQGKRLIDRAEFLGAVMKGSKHAVCISGTHGKTTTTSILTHALLHAGKDATVSVGGILDLIGGNIRVGGKDYFVTEACEYTNSFLKFFPTIAVITNIEADHLDFFSGLDEIKESFLTFASLTKGIGQVVACWDDANVRDTLKDSGLAIIKYGMNTEGCDYYPENIVYHAGYPSFDVMHKGEKKCHVQLNVPGDHNILNTLATVAVCDLLDVPTEDVAAGIETFHGTHRRFEKKGFVNGAIVLDDYAHHPTEIKATLKAADAFPHGKIYCIFQPHTYSRTRTLWNEFVGAFDHADEVILTHIYAAREVFDGVTKPENLAKEINQRETASASYIEEFSDIAEYIKNHAKEGDIVFTMGAGDVTNIGPMMVK